MASSEGSPHNLTQDLIYLAAVLRILELGNSLYTSGYQNYEKYIKRFPFLLFETIVIINVISFELLLSFHYTPFSKLFLKI